MSFLHQSQSQSIYQKHVTNVYAQYSVDTCNIESIQKPEEAIYNNLSAIVVPVSIITSMLYANSLAQRISEINREY